MVTVKKLSMVIAAMVIAVAVFSACFLSLKPAHASPLSTEVANLNSKPHTDSQVYGKFGEYVVLPEEKAARPRYSLAGLKFTFLATGAETGGKFTMYEFTTPAGKGLPLHYHTVQDEGYVILEGDATVQTGGVVNPSPPGTFGYLPKHGIHNYLNAGNTQSRTLGSVFPGTIEPYFKEAAQSLTDEKAPVPPSDYESQKTIAKKHGIVFVDNSDASKPTPLKQYHEHHIVDPEKKASIAKSYIGEAEYTLVASSEQTGGNFTQFEITAKPDSVFPLQYKTQGDVGFYVLEGELTLQMDGLTKVAPAGSFGYCPKQAICKTANLGTTSVKVMSFALKD